VLVADDQRVHLLTQVAQLYYEQSATQEAIAAALRISRPTVSRLLKEAREEGVVQIIINSPFHYVTSLETALVQAFPYLKQARVLRTTDSVTVARAAAHFVGSMVKDGDVLGVSWGNTMEEMTAFLPHRTLRSVTVVQLNGGVARAGIGTNAHAIVSRVGQALGADVYYLQVPAIVDSVSVREAMLQNRETAQVLALARRANVAVFGIGAPESRSVLVQAGYFSPQYLAGLRRKGAVGDICSRYFTVDGLSCDPELDRRTIGLALHELTDRETAIAVVYGVHKAAGTLGALRGRFVNALVIDEATAREILRLQEGGWTTHD
jgi:deoxyribonucleoside regulator